MHFGQQDLDETVVGIVGQRQGRTIMQLSPFQDFLHALFVYNYWFPKKGLFIFGFVMYFLNNLSPWEILTTVAC